MNKKITKSNQYRNISRRDFIKATGLAAGASTVLGVSGAAFAKDESISEAIGMEDLRLKVTGYDFDRY